MHETINAEVIVNGKNLVWLEGLVISPKMFTNEKGKKQLDFTLGHVSIEGVKEVGPTKFYTMYIKCSFYGRLAEDVETRIKPGSFVSVEGKLRFNSTIKQFKIVGVHIESAENIKKVIPIPKPEEV